MSRKWHVYDIGCEIQSMACQFKKRLTIMMPRRPFQTTEVPILYNTCRSRNTVQVRILSGQAIELEMLLNQLLQRGYLV